jgi:hypothetical protein
MTPKPPEPPRRNDPPEPSPATRQLARSLTVVLARVDGTGPGGQVVRQDVLDAHAEIVARGKRFSQMREARSRASSPTPAPSVRRPAPPRRQASAADGVYAANPLIAQARAEPGGRRRVAAAEGREPAPTLFAAGDLPAFTASGVDPGELSKVPWFARHHLASLTDKEAVEQLVRDYSGTDGDVMAKTDGVAGHPGNSEYRMRVLEWVDRGHKAVAAAVEDQQWRDVQQARQNRVQGNPESEDLLDGLFSRPGAEKP